ncbi:VCBS repeat-containing protein [Pontibacter sp. SGAir0037]|uniref:VCBS repeat-containing protein n=1 Tax=Pontibacter sp. SGAir0037 TaxID=2571030 RepID=UPI0010CCDB9F|nr:VCBS repeat-containing protein [Pontibacter sp. SGAir0037]QCR21342.1 RNA-binding protein [Pontibacter sp. SGAir0037]
MKILPLKLIPYLLIGIICACTKKEDTLFTLLSPDETGITFSNRIFESDTLNILTSEYVYNGGGVAVGDFNNDGLQDVYFTGNMVSNKLYLNKGDFKFDDITDKANVAGEGKWCSGVALVDINNDGWLDIYVGATMKKTPESRANLLYINNGPGKDGIPTFTESAEKYGIADTGHTTNAAFFDYDLDGDLDLYVLTNVINEGLPTTYHKKKVDGSAENNDRFYRNNGDGTFTNITQEAGIVIEGFGLGLAISDINMDGWPDVYVSNDYLSNDLLYINNQNGTFTNRIDEYINHTSYSAMGNSVTDINNDGLVDILALDMLPENNKRKKMMIGPNNYAGYINNDVYNYQHQYVRNTLQLHQGLTEKGEPVFSEIGQLAGIYQTDWSWAPLLADFDNDGLRDAIITNGFPRDVTDHDFRIYRSGSAGMVGGMYLIDSIPVVKIANYAFQNNGDLTFKDRCKEWGLTTPSFSNGAAYADLDNDGDLDFLVNNINDSAFVYQNQLYSGKKTSSTNHYLKVRFKGSDMNRGGIGAKLTIYYDNGKQQFHEHSLYKGYLSTVENSAHFGLGNSPSVDSLLVTWPDGRAQRLVNVKTNQTLTLEYVKASLLGASAPALSNSMPETAPLQEAAGSYNILFKHLEDDKIDFNVQKTMPHKYTQSGPGIAVGDIDGNGLEDFYIGGASGRPGTFFLQQSTGRFVMSDKQIIRNGPKVEEEMGVLFFDADQDGDLDLYVVSGSYEFEEGSPYFQDKVYKNNGKGIFTLDAEALPALYASGSCVKAADYDQDGDLDLFVGTRVISGKYPLAPASYILQNNNGRFTDVTAQVCPELKTLGMVADALWSDFDGDGQVDLIIAGEWMPVTFFKNKKGKLTNVTEATGLANKIGWWNSLVAGDFDGDGDIDYMAGNLGLNTNYVATEDMPLLVYAKDFDDNGNIDPVLACYMKAEDGTMKAFPMHNRDDLNAQMPRTRSIFARYANYSTATIEQVLKPEETKDALILRATHLANSYIENLGGGKFKLTALPVEAQLAPVYGMVTEDINHDGNLDVLLVGNDYGTEVFTGRYDAFKGLYLQGNGKGGFVPQPLSRSGFYVPGDAKGLATLYGKNGERIVLATQNQDNLKVFTLKESTAANNLLSKTITLNPQDAWAQVFYKNGRKAKVEFYYGSTYLSQSGRMFKLTPDMEKVVMYTFTGKSRTL